MTTDGKVFLDKSETFTKLDSEDNHVFGTTVDQRIIAKAGNDHIIGGGGDDVLEGNRGDDTLKGGADEDLLFGGVGNDRLIGGSEADTFSMRITHGGENTITDFELGSDTLQFVLDRKHFLLENDLTKNDRHEGRVDDKLDSKVDKLDNRFFGEDFEYAEGATGEDKADTFVQAAIDNKLDISIDGDALVLTFFGSENDLGGGSKGTTIRLNNLADNEHIQRILNSSDDADTQQDSIIEMLTTGTIIGTGDNDEITGSDGDDHIKALGGDDHFKGYGDKSLGNDTLDGGEGFDTANYWYQQGHIDAFVDENGNISVEQITNSRLHSEGEEAEFTDTLIDVEKIVGTRGEDQYDFSNLSDMGDGKGITITDNSEQASNDLAIGSDFDDDINLLHGDDIIYGGKGTDTLKVTLGNNQIFGEEGDDRITGGNHEDILDGGEGNDYIVAGNYYASHDTDTTDLHDTLIGGNGNDTLRGSNGNDLLQGGNGEDEIYAGGGDDEIQADQYSPAHKALYLEDDIVDGGDGVDSLWYNDTYKNADHLNVETKNGTTFTVEGVKDGNVTSTDTVSNVEILFGTRGDDVIDFSGLGHGMTYNDKWTGAGEDKVTGTDYDDVINVMNGDDTIIGSGGNDTIDGGHGIDEIIYAAGTNISIEANGPAYKNEYKITNTDDGSFDIVKNIESISVENGDEYSFSDGEYSLIG
ncbi:calcium-binding protein [uncultured Vibrio sp.]|uniref:calcium-binding protein n=1 Tax=uncultured Vibrio sp. TaxID=114054 RepID=UPI0025EF567A|nr:calcium-binding protein [uncultured Vibrio sp.]